MKRAVPVLVVVFVATILAATTYAIATPLSLSTSSLSTDHTFGLNHLFLAHQGIAGSVSIANVSPVCALTGSQPASGPSLVVTSADGRILVVSLSWSLVDRCALETQFKVPLQPGTYSLTLSPCGYMGCRTLPITVVVQSGVFAPANISIVTGIV